LGGRSFSASNGPPGRNLIRKKVRLTTKKSTSPPVINRRIIVLNIKC